MFSMEKYAVIQLGSRQFLVHEGDIVRVERQEKPLKVDVMMFSDGETPVLGTPNVAGIKVKLSVVEETFDKTRVGRFKSKSRYHKTKGHKQPVSIIKVESIGKAGSEKSEELNNKAEVKSEVKSEPKKAAKKTVRETKIAKDVSAVAAKKSSKKLDKKS